MNKKEFKKFNKKINEMINLLAIGKHSWGVGYYNDDLIKLGNLKLSVQQKYKERVLEEKRLKEENAE